MFKRMDGPEKLMIADALSRRFGRYDCSEAVRASHRLHNTFCNIPFEFHPAWFQDRITESWHLLKFFTYYRGE
jgi:hypothetical protein